MKELTISVLFSTLKYLIVVLGPWSSQERWLSQWILSNLWVYLILACFWRPKTHKNSLFGKNYLMDPSSSILTLVPPFNSLWLQERFELEVKLLNISTGNQLLQKELNFYIGIKLRTWSIKSSSVIVIRLILIL